MKDTEISETKTKLTNKKALLIQRIGAVAFCVAVIIAAAYCYFKYGKQIYNAVGSPESLENFLKRFNGYDKLVFVAIRAIQTVIKIIPAEPLEIGSGILYGTWGGLLYCILGTAIGSAVIILLTKIFGRKIVEIFVPLEKINSLKFLQNEKRVYLVLFFIYLIPGTPKDIITYIAGITDINLLRFFLITGFARIPSIVSSTLCGEQIINKNYGLAVAVYAVTLVAGVISALVYKKYSDKKNKATEVDNFDENQN